MNKYDLIVIGMGPAGMAVSAMGVAMGLKVLAIEKNKVGGECLNIGCIPSKAILKAGEALYNAKNIQKFGIEYSGEFSIINPLQIVRDKVDKINKGKMMKVFDAVDIIINKGSAEFINKKEIKVNNKIYKAKKIFVATGSKAFVPPIKGVDTVDYLTNENIFYLDRVPQSLMVIGGGAIGCEMAQAFSRLGAKVTIAHFDNYLMPVGEKELGDSLQEAFESQGIEVYNKTKILEIQKNGDKVKIITDNGEFVKDKVLIATGRKVAVDNLGLEKAGIEYDKRGIKVDKYLRTSNKSVYAIGDVNSHAMFSHSAMHQGMLALMHALSPIPLKMFKYKDYHVPWSVFTDPEVAGVGLTEKQAREKYKNIKVVKKDFETYGRSLADSKTFGFIKIITKNNGRILGVSIVGQSASEMIHEWALALYKKMNIKDIMFMQHSFPTFSMLNKMVAEDWMMGLMKKSFMQKMVRLFW